MAKKILIVEDEIFIAEMYKIKFESAGYEVFLAHDGVEGVSAAHERLPDLVLLDLLMPQKDGYQTLKELREEDGTKDLKIYILSNMGQKEEIEKGMNLGANGFFVKAHLTPTQLLEKINELI
ncbi:response regulator [Candidatus Parcubacteria bacterium]|nr:MAG: response regulator [Candidatus Parcubacteria bacterium]